MSHDEPMRMSRRSVLGAALWAAPAIVVATGVPARAASGDNVYVDDVLIFNNVTLYPENNGAIGGNFSYRVDWTDGFPEGELAQCTWNVTATKNDDPDVSLSAGGTEYLPNAGTSANHEFELTDVPPGDYTFVVTVTATVTDPETGTTYYTTTEEVQTVTVV
ncbi:hypothetical protein ON058_09575 [Demequina sp. B12]|uniref:hypothetical protein n=1 Tax=Demequina sp. B12 TaxID=2992757 RepID=UPI00237B98D7|nr:hypothetical protein [Demequina sp. B12]MDE0573662.1 hypothetical protein [Demequina sp. B12]